jgi:hypothetical protein
MPGARSTSSLAQRGLHQRQPRQLALREHVAVGVDDHPGAVEVEPGFHHESLASATPAQDLTGCTCRRTG